MKKLELKKGFNLQLAGLPDVSTITLPVPDTVAASAMDIPYIRPKILVKTGDDVLTGSPLFCDKRNRSIQYLSPGTGKIKDILFGPRRKLKEIVIDLDKTSNESVQFKKIDRNTLQNMSRQALAEHLKEGGLWQCFRQFPARDTADPEQIPSMIIVSLNGNDPFSPHPATVLDKNLDYFQFGIDIVRQLTRSVVVTCRESSLPRLNHMKPTITHLVPDTYPSWDPGSVLYQLKTMVADNNSWCITAEHLILVAKLLLDGRYPVKRVVTIARTQDRKPHIITRQGAPIKNLVGRMDKKDIITSGRFNGREIALDSHLGFFENSLNILPGPDEDEMFGFMLPGWSKTSVSNTFLSCLSPSPKKMDCTIHGEERACINCASCIRICPVDLHPNFIMKNLHSDDIEDALNYGLLDCCRCGLCSYACPSKIELTKILSDGMDAHFKDKE